MRILLVAFYFPPAGGGGVQRPIKLATHLAALGFEVHVLTPDDPKWIHRDESVTLPPEVVVHRTRFVGPRGRKPAEELYATSGLTRRIRRASLLGRRFLVPDEAVTWAATAIPAAIRLVRHESIDVVVTTSPPNSIHLIGAATKLAGRVAWVADLRDPICGHPHRDLNRRAVRVKEKTQSYVAALVARRADAVTAVSEAIADDMRALHPGGSVTVVPNGADFDDFDQLVYRPNGAFRITHTGAFFGSRDPKPFLTALSNVDGITARFVGDFRSADRAWLEERPVAERVELIPFVSRRRSLELQRDSEALLLLIPNADGRGRGILSGKVFEYLAAERPILGLVPPDGAAAGLLRQLDAATVVDPDDVGGIEQALADLRDRWATGRLEPPRLDEGKRASIARETHVRRFADVLVAVGGRRPTE